MYVVVIDCEVPQVIGPFRSEQRADAIAEKWNAEHDTNDDGYAWVRPCVKTINDIDD